MRTRERGAALLVAMLLMATVATLSAASLWKQWRDVEVEAAERSRVQSAWILTGALDWARLILREDAGGGALDHLAEPWAVPLREARLDTFLAAGAGSATMDDSEAADVFLSGRIVDLQSRLNVSNLVAAGSIVPSALRSFQRLFDTLGLPQPELARMTENLRLASEIGLDNALADTAPALPQRLEHLQALGLSAASVAALEPYATVLPGRTPLNLNTASAEAIYSVVGGIAIDDARRLVAARDASPFKSVNEAARLLPRADGFTATEFSVASRFFEVRGRLRSGRATMEERSVVQRDGADVVVLQRGRRM
jgi:general secretion pathway protein K